MILTLAWKEVREHQAIWLAMVVMTIVLGLGLGRIVAPADQASAIVVGELTILGMAIAYGVVCGAMMFAGEHEGGTLVFLDVFSGRRDFLWLGKCLVGGILALAEAVTVALVLYLLERRAPAWGLELLGQREPGRQLFALGPDLWFVVLPMVTLEAYAWGLLGSALTRNVLKGAALAAVGTMPVWMISLASPPQVFLLFRLAAVFFVLVISCFSFMNQAREAVLEVPDQELQTLRRRSYEQWNRFDRDDWVPRRRSRTPPPLPSPDVLVPAARRVHEPEQARSPSQVLWWLTVQQAHSLFWPLAGIAFVLGFFMPSHGQVLWPLATLAIGVACGTAAFAPEQRDLSYQFLASQHLPLNTIWRFKILFWFAAACLATLALALSGWLLVLERVFLRPGQRGGAVDVPNAWQLGTLRDLMGPVLFFGVCLVYGFCAAQIVVWLCRKSILAVLLAGLAGGTALAMWLPSLLCGGMSGWQLWLPPLAMLLASRYLVRAWAGGRIKERRPLTALAGFSMAALAWVFVNLGWRAWEIPDVGEPLNRIEFRASLPDGKANAAGQKIESAIALINTPNDVWLAKIAEMTRLPLGMAQTPRGDGQSPLTQHLRPCEIIAQKLMMLARAKDFTPAFEHLAQAMALSRNLRNKASLESYLAGIMIEEMALDGFDRLLARGKPPPDELRRVLDELNRHAAEIPLALDCLRTECFRAGGVLDNPQLWTFASEAHRVPGRIAERGVAGNIALSLETPWEAERKTRLWQLVWAGLFRAVETPHWQLPEPPEKIETAKEATRNIMLGWLPTSEGAGAGVTFAQLTQLLDASWVSDERLFCLVVRLRAAATRARWRVDSTRQAVALALYQMQEGKLAASLKDLVPMYFPAGLPIDPYSGEAFHYRIDNAEQPGRATIWSTGPDHIDNGGHNHGGRWADDDSRWAQGEFDLIMTVPHWP